MTVMNDIRQALDARLAATSGLPSVFFENVPNEQVPTTSHVRVQFISTSRRPANRGPNPQHRIQGLYILTVCTPIDEGSGLALDYVDSLLDRFNGSSDVAGVAITVSIEYSEAQSAFVDEPFYCVPIEIAWYAYE